VEILIAVTILGILAMIVVPFAMDATDDARESALVTDLQTLRRQVELYKLEHGGQGPHLNHRGRRNTRNTIARLTGRTDPDGRINADGICGPYLLEWPENPFCDPSVAGNVQYGRRTSPPRRDRFGWYYNIDTCLFSANSREGAESLDP